MIARLQVKEVAGYDEDVVFLVVPDESNFGKWVPIVLGTCTLVHVINVIKESEMDLDFNTLGNSTPCAAVIAMRHDRETPSEGDGGADMPEKKGVDTVVKMGGSACVGPFQTEILEGKISQAPMYDTHVMGNTLRASGTEAGQGASTTPLGCRVLHTYMTMTGWPQTNIHSGAKYD